MRANNPGNMLQPVFTPFPVLKTERLLLRQILMSDADEVFFLRSNEDVIRYVYKEPALSIKDAEDHIELVTKNISANESILWGIALHDEPSKLIGSICYWNLRKEHDRAEIGYVLHPNHWRKGIMKEALMAVIAYGFDIMKLHSIDAWINAENNASAAILEAVGFTKEAYFKEDVFFRDRYFDTIVYSRLQ